jgi:predicted dehydrogenase
MELFPTVDTGHRTGLARTPPAHDTGMHASPMHSRHWVEVRQHGIRLDMRPHPATGDFQVQPILNVALVGYGFVGKAFHAPLIRHTPGLRLHTVASSDAGKVLADHPDVRVFAAADAAFADPDIDLVVIAAPNTVHAPLANAALAAGKHVVVDKPFTITTQEAREVVANAARAQRLVSVFQNRRWDSDFLTLQQLIAAGTLGEIAEFHSHFDRHRPIVADRWREHDLPGSGLWYDLGPHLIDQALQLFGMPVALTADIGLQRVHAHTPDYFHVLLRYPTLRVVLHAGSLVPANGLRFAVHGTRGSYVKHGLDVQESALRAGAIPGQVGWGVDSRPGELHEATDEGMRVSSLPGIAGDYRAYYAAMRDAIVHGSPLPVTPSQALDVMAMLEWGMQSALERREIACTAFDD